MSAPLSDEQQFEPLSPDFKAKWLCALRDGSYRQGREALKTDEGCFCCLGVALDLMEPDSWNKAPLIIESDERDEGVAAYGWNGFKPTEVNGVARAIGISVLEARELINRNDGLSGHDPRSFPEIADWIEENL